MSLRFSPLVLLAACGPASRPAAGGMSSSGSSAPVIYLADVARPTWGTPARVLLDRFGGVRAGSAITTLATVEGREAKVTFHLVKGGLGSLVVSWTERFGDMGQCSDEFAHVRQSLDAILGESSSDNLAAYWDSETLQASLDCSPEASGQGYLKLRVEDPRTSR